MKKIEVKLVNKLPEEIEIKPTARSTAQTEWYGHSYGEQIGRIYADGSKDSFLVHDREKGNTEWFAKLMLCGQDIADCLTAKPAKRINVMLTISCMK